MPIDHKVYDLSEVKVVLGGVALEGYASVDACFGREPSQYFSKTYPGVTAITPANEQEQWEVTKFSIELTNDWNDWRMNEDLRGRSLSQDRVVREIRVFHARYVERLKKSPLAALGWTLYTGADEEGAAFLLRKKKKVCYLMYVSFGR